MKQEGGQAAVEFGLIAMALLLLTLGLLDVGRAFYQYNTVSSAARYGARYGGIVGGTCSDVYNPPTSGDWCNQGTLGGVAPSGSCTTPPSGIPSFWASNGNWPCQGVPGACPSTLDTSFTGYYTASDFVGSTYPSIVAMIVNRFDTNSSSSNFIGNAITPGLDMSKLKVCVQMNLNPDSGQVDTKPGAKVTVFVYYPFNTVGPLFGNVQVDLIASSQYTIE